MAEAFLKKLGGDLFVAESAGLEAGVLNPLAISVMKEEGIDISGNETRNVDDFFKERRTYDYVVTVCDAASAERCPVFPGKHTKLHWYFDDPSSFTGSSEQKLEQTRKVRDQIRRRIEEFLRGFGNLVI